jgi:hypothetical protein
MDVYWNLHKQCWSLRMSGTVIAHMHRLGMTDVTFRVQPAGQARVRREGKKNVHAYAKGEYNTHEVKQGRLGREITYNPYKHDSFVYKDDLTPVTHCDRVWFDNKHVWEVV